MNFMKAIEKGREQAKLAARNENSDTGEFSLRGTGFTKKISEKANNQYERESNLSFKAAEATGEAKKVADEFAAKTDADIEHLRVQGLRADIILDESQEGALKGMIEQRFAILIGAAGTGKTTVTREFAKRIENQIGLIDLRRAKMQSYELVPGDKSSMVRETRDKQDNSAEKAEWHPAIAGCAYTGRAVQQMKKAFPVEYHKSFSTIHSLLGYAPEKEEFENDKGEWKTRTIFRPGFNKNCKLPYKVILMDESGMTPINLWNELIDALEPDARIYLIGDINQLPPVHGKGVLGYAMTQWPVFELTTIHRQAADNPIIANAHRILNGQIPIAVKGKFDIISGDNIVSDYASKARLATYSVVTKLYEGKAFDPITDALIVPQNGGELGQQGLNEMLVTYFNPEKKVNGIILNKRVTIHTGTDHVVLATGDKIMMLANDKDRNLTNGMIGVIESLNLNGKYDNKRSQIDNMAGSDQTFDFEKLATNADAFKFDEDNDEEEKSLDQRQSSHVAKVKFADGQEADFSTAGDYKRLAHAYAFTCHKSQGGEYPVVIVVVHSANAIMLTREWLYTAVTRARDRLILICNDIGLSKAVNRQVVKGRTLKEKIENYNKMSNVVFDVDSDVDRNKFPILWKAQAVK